MRVAVLPGGGGDGETVGVRVGVPVRVAVLPGGGDGETVGVRVGVPVRVAVPVNVPGSGVSVEVLVRVGVPGLRRCPARDVNVCRGARRRATARRRRRSAATAPA